MCLSKIILAYSIERIFMRILVIKGKHAHKYANKKAKYANKMRVKLTKSVANLIGK